jgi:glycosyltransferase involved in cell wall biosynthesis
MPLAACIITKNEEANLPRCLASLRGVVDEIVVVDSGSIDQTRTIAEAAGARWLVNPWQGYVAQKNFALSQTFADWVLLIDADEELSPRLREVLLRFKASPATPPVNGLRFSRVVFYQGQWIRFGDWYPDRLVRVIRRGHAQFTGGAVHERLEVKGKIQDVPGELHHYSFHSEEDYLKRMDHYSDLWASQAKKDGKKAYPWTPWLRSSVRLLRSYLLKGGWQGGPLGRRLAQLQAREVRLKYAKLRTLLSNT